MRHHSLNAFSFMVVMLAVLGGCDAPAASNGGGSAPTVAPTATPAASEDASAAADYCMSKGRKVVTRRPAHDTNGSNPLILSGSLQLCQFTAHDKSMIAISLHTLYSDQPTLATLEYLQPPRVETAPTCTNPASVYCSKLGGSDQFGGVNAAGGGWVLDEKNDPFYMLQYCISPDLSTIDS